MKKDTRIETNLRSRIGCHCWGDKPEHFGDLALFAESGVRWVRATRQTQWDTISKGPRQYDFGAAGERSIDLMIEHGMSVMSILDARWGNETRVNKLAFASPVWEHLDQWEHFVTASVEHYKGRIEYWEVLNEPPFFWWYPTREGDVLPELDTPLIRASVANYAKILRSASRAIRQADPAAKVVVGSGFCDGVLLRKLYELGCGDCFDVASVHYLNCRHPADFARAHGQVRTVMAEFGDANKPLWDTENGPGGAVIGNAVQTVDQYHALYNIYRHCVAHEFGLDRYFWFCGWLTREEDKFRSMKALHGHVGEGALLGAEHIQDDVHLYTFDGPAGPASILWSTAPAAARLENGLEAKDFLGQPVRLGTDVVLTGRPLLIAGDLRGRVDATVTGRRETVVTPMKQPPAEVPTATCRPVDRTLTLDDAGWSRVPLLADRNQIPLAGACTQGAALVPTSVTADVQMTYTREHVMFRVRLIDAIANPDRPTGLFQFILRDSDPSVPEWGYFTNSYSVFSLLLDGYHGLRLLRHESHRMDLYPPGEVKVAASQWRAEGNDLWLSVQVPWSEIGPCRPGQHNPFLLMLSLSRTDNMLDVPAGDDVAEWSHNLVDIFIIKTPALARWLVLE